MGVANSLVAMDEVACHWRGDVTLTLTVLMGPMRTTAVSTHQGAPENSKD